MLWFWWLQWVQDTMEYQSLRELVLVCVGVVIKRTMYQRKVDADMLNAVKSMLADVSSVSPSSEQNQRALCSDEGLTPLETPANILFTSFSISTSTLC